MVDQLTQVVGQQVHVPSAAVPVRPAVSAPVVGHAPEARIEQARDDVLPLV